MKSLCFLFLCFSFFSWAQKPEYSIVAIPQELKENANAVIRYEEININISSRSSVTIKKKRVVTVLNEYGQKHIDAFEYRNVRSVGATIYDASGAEIKKLKRKDFKDALVSDEAEVTDNRVTYLEYTPTQYPFTIVYESEVSDANTAHLPLWMPIDKYHQSLEKAVVKVTCASGLGFRYKEINLPDGFEKTATENGVSYTLQKIPARKAEQYSPPLKKLVPQIDFAVDKFSLEGVEGQAASWQEFGKWMQSSLLNGTNALPQDAKDKIIALVGNETDPIKKAKIVYQYVQSRTRYVSIQLGIGGWKPMKVADVHRLGYGDCKALTNYTKALLDAVGVASYYSVIHADNGKIDLDSDFVSLQGNHVTLAIPDGEKMRWVECTSQTSPFDFQANFTDDRLALIVKPDGGEIVRTKVYSEKDNLQLSRGSYAIDASGKLSGNIEIRTGGTQYAVRQALISKSVAEKNDYYKEYFPLNNLLLEKTEIIEDKSKPECIEKISMSAMGFAGISGARMMFAPNAFNQYAGVPQRYRNRTNPFEIDRGFYDEDEITIELPDGFVLEAKPEDVEIKDVYGQYKSEYKIIDPKHLLYKRSLLISKGNYPAEDYEKFRKFREQIAKADNAKCVLLKT